MSMWWGLNMKPNRKYTQTIVQSFHLSGAAIDEGSSAKLYLTANQNKYILASLDTTKSIYQVPLDLNFCIGDKIAFQTTGNATVSLIGYMHDAGDSDDEDYEDEEYAAVAKALQKQQKAGGGKGAAKNDSESEEGSEEEEDDSKLAAEYSSFLDEEESGDEEGEEDDDEDGEDDDDDDDEEDDSEAEDTAPQPKKPKLNENNKKTAKEQNGVAKKEDKQQQQQQKSKKDKKGAAAATTAEIKKEQPKGKDAKQQQSGGERAITGGVKVLDVSAGSGPEAKQGKRVSVYYIGRLKSNNKTFDSMQKGNGFKFALGGGEVIKGWDVGVVGMKVGGKRRITCPPHMAYGARGQPPTIPPNSTLVFDVELKAVH